MTLLKRGGKVRKALLAVQQTESEVERLQRGATVLREKLGSGRSQSSWRAFENVTKVLVDAGECRLLCPRIISLTVVLHITYVRDYYEDFSKIMRRESHGIAHLEVDEFRSGSKHSLLMRLLHKSPTGPIRSLAIHN